MRQFINLH